MNAGTLAHRKPGEAEFHLPIISLFSVAIALLFAHFGPEYLAFSAHGSPAWTWLTCHFAHWDLSHLFWSCGAFVVLGVLCELRDTRRFLLALLLPMMLIPLQMVLAKSTDVYAGLSGIDSALFTLMAALFISDCRKSGDRVWAGAGALLLLGFGGKLLWESLFGSALFAQSAAFVPTPAAHLIGGAAGLAAAWLPIKCNYFLRSNWRH